MIRRTHGAPALPLKSEGGDACLGRRVDSPARVRALVEQRRYDRIAWAYDFGQWPMEVLVYGHMRRRLFAGIGSVGRLLEVGVGTGQNLRHYPPGVSGVAVDLSPRMLARARARAGHLGLAVELSVADAQALPFDDDSFDTVLATFVFCSVPDPVVGLKELGRVCRPGGRVLLLEHVRPEGALAGWLADLVDPLVSRLWGAHVNRPTVALVREAGLRVRVERRELALFRTLELAPPSAREVKRD